MDDQPDLELMANRFNRLVKELLDGAVRRTSFQPWEVDLLLDLQACRLIPSRRDEALRQKRYQRGVLRKETVGAQANPAARQILGLRRAPE